MADATIVTEVITELSQAKVSKTSKVKYISRRVSDTKKSYRVIVFDPVLRSKLEKIKQAKRVTSIVNCKIK